jgi:hypothetical protein
VRLRSGADGTTWPFPFPNDRFRPPAWKARFAPHTLTPTDAMELAGYADAYATLISHPVRAVAETIFDLRRVYREVYR